MRHMRTVLLCAAVTAVFMTAGCGDRKSAASDPSASPSTSVPAGTHASSATPSPAATAGVEKQAAIESYYGNTDMTALVSKPATIRFTKDADKYLTALNVLKKSPSQDAVSLCSEITFRSAKLEGDKLTVDLSLSDKSRLGSGGEAMLLEAFKKTLFQFKEVQSFEILVDGKKAESLMGHMELLYPFKR